MNLDLFHNLIKPIKENGIVEKFIQELNDFLGQEQSLLQKIDNEGKVTVDYRDKMLLERNKILIDYAKETQEKGAMYFVYNKDAKDNMYHITMCEDDGSHNVIEIPKNKLPKGAGVDSVLRYVDGKYIFDEKSTKEVTQLMSEMVDRLLEEQMQSLKEWRQEGHTYVVTENTGDKVWLFDETVDSQNGECIDDIDFPKELMNIAKEGTKFKYINANYVN